MASGEEGSYSPELVSERPEAPKRDHMLLWMEISVSEPEKRTGTSMKMQDTYVVYLVESKVTDAELPGYGEGPTSLWRRYNEFELLRQYLEITYPAIVVPPLPEKRVSHVWQKLATDRFDPDFIERRRGGLENFLLRCASHTTLSHDKVFKGFLTQEDGWKEAVYATDFQNKADSKLKALSASFRLKKPDQRFQELRNYSDELQNNINTILRTRARLVDRTYGIHKLHANYGRVFSEWSGIEKDMADGLQSAGHFMDVYATSIDAIMEDDEQFADQLKEYYAFGESLRAVCRKHELLQLDLEKAEDLLTSRTLQKEQLMSGKTNAFSLTGMKSKLFGGDTPEQRDQKLKVLDEQIAEAQEQVGTASDEIQKFVEISLKDIDRFKRQKTKDLKEIFINYAIMQIDRCKKGIQVWQNSKDCFGKM